MSNDDDKYDDPRDRPAAAFVRVGPGPLDFEPIRGFITETEAEETEDEDQERFSLGLYEGGTRSSEGYELMGPVAHEMRMRRARLRHGEPSEDFWSRNLGPLTFLAFLLMFILLLVFDL